jgi:uncharacterized DUF497 family protein
VLFGTYAVLALLTLAGFVWMTVTMAQGRSLYSRWTAITNPIVCIVLGSLLDRVLPDPLSQWLEGAGLNLGMLLFFALSLALLWNERARGGVSTHQEDWRAALYVYNAYVTVVWDAVKAEANFRKHREHFSDAEGALSDPIAITIADDASGEQRFVTIGFDTTGRLVVVVYTGSAVKWGWRDGNDGQRWLAVFIDRVAYSESLQRLVVKDLDLSTIWIEPWQRVVAGVRVQAPLLRIE